MYKLKNEATTLAAVAAGLRAGEYPNFDMDSANACIGNLAYRYENVNEDDLYTTSRRHVVYNDGNNLYWPPQGSEYYHASAEQAADAIDRYLAGNVDNPWLVEGVPADA